MNWNFATLTRKRVFLASLTNKETLGRKEMLGKLFDFRTYLDFTPTLHSTFFDAGVTKAKEKLLSTALPLHKGGKKLPRHNTHRQLFSGELNRRLSNEILDLVNTKVPLFLLQLL